MNSNPLNKVYILLISIVILSSCATPYRTIMIETARPSTNQLSEDIKSLTLMNRSITNEFRKYDSDSLQSYFYSRQYDVEAVILDSLAADSTLKILADLLYESGRYDVVVPVERNLDREKPFNEIPNLLDWDEVKSICDDYNTDALLVIERFYNKLTTDFTMSPSLFSDSYAYASIDSKYNAIVRIYDPVKMEVSRQFVVDDTIYWYKEGPTSENVFSQMPPIKEALIQTGIQIALEIDEMLSPQWIRDSRAYFILEKSNYQQVSNLIEDNNWQELYNYWLPYSESEKKSIKSKAEFNLALASEMLDQLDLAIEWADKSYFTQYRNLTVNYLYKLKERKEILEQFEEL